MQGALARVMTHNELVRMRRPGVTAAALLLPASLIGLSPATVTAAPGTGVVATFSATDTGASAMTPAKEIASLIVRYRPGVTPTVRGKVRGSSLVAGRIGAGMTLGPNLGRRMYRIDLAQSLSIVQATRVASQMMKDPGIVFVEPDRLVSAQFTRD